ncbi:hypothetical protein MPAN_016080 [Mariniplasma anaerobium]|uniref:Uncharacterized protein n=1 Tax=Mariniplasma anaerobium TaxID=2735436 RepID=A0A7U9XVT3_9MOLU|nr:hypothetical protein MPAN_016080 [Mariniplasma anaerobium]
MEDFKYDEIKTSFIDKYSFLIILTACDGVTPTVSITVSFEANSDKSSQDKKKACNSLCLRLLFYIHKLQIQI